MKIFFVIYFILVIIVFFWTLYLDTTTDSPLLLFDSKNPYDTGDLLLILVVSVALPLSLPMCICRTIGRVIQKGPHRLKKTIVLINEMLVLLIHKPNGSEDGNA